MTGTVPGQAECCTVLQHMPHIRRKLQLKQIFPWHNQCMTRSLHLQRPFQPHIPSTNNSLSGSFIATRVDMRHATKQSMDKMTIIGHGVRPHMWQSLPLRNGLLRTLCMKLLQDQNVCQPRNLCKFWLMCWQHVYQLHIPCIHAGLVHQNIGQLHSWSRQHLQPQPFCLLQTALQAGKHTKDTTVTVHESFAHTAWYV